MEVRRVLASASLVYDAYWEFADRRLALYLQRVQGEASREIPDPILTRHRFTNSYRACDRVTQYLIRQVQYQDAHSPEDLFLRTMLFKLFNRVETWQLICAEVGNPSTTTFDVAAIDLALRDARASGQRIYSAAYIVPPTALAPNPKHLGHLRLVEYMLEQDLPARAQACGSLEELYQLLLAMPGLGPFLAFQFAIDLNYSELVDFPEAQFVVAGPGARDGLAKCFPEATPKDAEALIRLVCDVQEEEFEKRGIPFRGLWGRRLQPIDCQNLFCEISKYARLAFPEVRGTSGRTNIKQLYRPAGPLAAPYFPPKWGLNQALVTSA